MINFRKYSYVLCLVGENSKQMMEACCQLLIEKNQEFLRREAHSTARYEVEV